MSEWCDKCGRSDGCVCDDPAFEDAVCDRDRDAIIEQITKRRQLERELAEFHRTEPLKVRERNDWRMRAQTAELELAEAQGERQDWLNRALSAESDLSTRTDQLCEARKRVRALREACAAYRKAEDAYERAKSAENAHRLMECGSELTDAALAATEDAE